MNTKKILDSLENWRNVRHLTIEGQRYGLRTNLNEEYEEYITAKNDNERIDALCDIVIFLLNAYPQILEQDIDRALKEAEPKDFKEIFDIETFDGKGKAFTLMIKCFYEIKALGYDYGLCLEETIKEINDRTGHWDDEKKKFIKDIKAGYKANYDACLLPDRKI